jgi:hypothetical protein
MYVAVRAMTGVAEKMAVTLSKTAYGPLADFVVSLKPSSW